MGVAYSSDPASEQHDNEAEAEVDAGGEASGQNAAEDSGEVSSLSSRGEGVETTLPDQPLENRREDDVNDEDDDDSSGFSFARTRKKRNESPYTRVPPPGAQAFLRWIRDPATPKPVTLEASSQLSHPLELSRRDDLYHDSRDVQAFMGHANERLIEGLRRRRAEVNENPQQLHYDTVTYEQIDTPIYHHHVKEMAQQGGIKNFHCRTILRQRLCRKTQPKTDDPIAAYLWQERHITRMIVVLIGFFMSVVAFVVGTTSTALLDAKISLATSEENPMAGFAIFLTVNLAFGLLAFLPVAFKPVAAGSGIAEAKAVLNGIIVPECTQVKTAVCKAVSVVFSMAASLPVGLEGPLIFMGLATGKNANRLVPMKYTTFRMQSTQRDLAAVGTASGVAAAFYTPVGGVLFAMEEGCSFWSNGLTMRCFAAALVTAVFSYIWKWIPLAKDTSWGSNFNVMTLSKFNGIPGQEQMLEEYDPVTFHLFHYFIFGAMGVVGGTLGAFWNESNWHLTLLRRRWSNRTLVKCVEIVVLVFVMSSLSWWLPRVYQECGDLNATYASDKYFRQYGCPQGQYNQLATLLLNAQGEVGINLLFYEPKVAFSVTTCLIAGTLYLVMLLVFFGTSVAMGIFIPLLFIGACYGRVLGILLNFGDVRAYTIVGSVAMLAGVARVLISLTVIMVAATGLSYMITPFMVATIMARVAGESIFGKNGIYDMILQLKGMPFLEEEVPTTIPMRGLKALDIMSPPPLVTLSPVMNIGEILEELGSNCHSDFVVVDDSPSDPVLIGVVGRRDLMVLLQSSALFYDAGQVANGSGSLGLKFEELQRKQSRNVDLESIAASLSEEDLALSIDLTPYVQMARCTFDRFGSAERAYLLFRRLGLRHMVVTGAQGRPIGVINRSDLALLEYLGEDDYRSTRPWITLPFLDNVS